MIKNLKLTITFLSIIAFTIFTGYSKNKAVSKQPFGTTKDGKTIELYTLVNKNFMQAKIMNYGAIIVSLTAPDKNGKMDDIVLGYDDLNGYIKKNPYFGSIVGRYANRIANGKFTLNAKEYTLACNNGKNHLHGGKIGFDKVIWNAVPKPGYPEGPALELSYTSKDGEEGYPGTLTLTVTYILTHNNELKILYHAVTDKDTIINPSNHSYFNLAGQGTRDILDHVITINADKFTPVDSSLIPTGELRPVKGTPFDFTKPKTFGLEIKSDDEQIKFGGGYDHNWVLNKEKPGELTLAAAVYEPITGRYMEVFTTEPGFQVYSGNFLDGSITGKKGRIYKHRFGFIMEAQHYPDTPNKPDFPSCVLKPGREYTQTTVYKFSVK